MQDPLVVVPGVAEGDLACGFVRFTIATLLMLDQQRSDTAPALLQPSSRHRQCRVAGFLLSAGGYSAAHTNRACPASPARRQRAKR
jgi:hypothetical protein